MQDLIEKLREGLAGRSARQEFWVRFVIQFMGSAVLGFILGLFGLPTQIAALLTLPLWLYIGARRLHDLGLTGWLAPAPFAVNALMGFASLLPIPGEILTPLLDVGPVVFALLFILWLGCVPGQRETNRFGPPPGQEGPAEVF